METRAIFASHTAYNDVAYRLTAATAERKQSDAQMRQFIADAGHELRTPLTVVMGYLDVLRQGIISDSALQIYETMLDESRRIARSSRIDLSRPAGSRGAQTLGAIDLTATASRAVRTLAPLADGRIHLHEDGPAIVIADEDGFMKRSKTLSTNALEYAPDSQVDVRATQEGQSACVRVTDTGPGMDPADVAHAFDRFYRGSARGEIEGSGLGLAIAKRAIQRAGGTIDIVSTPGAGTEIAMCLPKGA